MIINIYKRKDLDLVKGLPIEVTSIIEETLDILDDNYGIERTVGDLGGYITVVDKEDVMTLKKEVLKGIIPEYIDEIEGVEYISALFLCSSDFSIVVICSKDLRNIIES